MVCPSLFVPMGGASHEAMIDRSPRDARFVDLWEEIKSGGFCLGQEEVFLNVFSNRTLIIHLC